MGDLGQGLKVMAVLIAVGGILIGMVFGGLIMWFGLT